MARRPDAAPTLGLVLIRLVTGGFLVSLGWRFVREAEPTARVVERSIEAALGSVHPVLHWWGEDVLLYNPDAIAFFLRWGALFVGVSFVLGGLVRPFGLVAAFFLANAMAFGPSSQTGLYLMLVGACLGCAFAGAGRRFGLDSIFDQHFPAWLTWHRRSPSSFLS